MERLTNTPGGGHVAPQHCATLRVAVVTSIHPDFDARLWKYARSLRNQGVDTYFVSSWNVPDREFDGIHFRSFRPAISRWGRLAVTFRVLGQLIRIIRRIDIVHFHDIDLLPLMVFIAMLKPVVYDCHENYPDEMLSRPWVPDMLRRPLRHIVRLTQWACVRLIGNAVLVAPSQEKDLPLKHVRWMYVRNYASVALAEEATPDYLERSNTIIFTGSQYVGNGSLLLLEITDEIRREVPDLRVICFDKFQTIEFKAAFLKEVEVRRLSENIILVPQCRAYELARYLNQGRVAISPNLRTTSQVNGVHTKLFEYMAAALPMVVSDLPHQVEMLRDAECGLLAQPERPATFVSAVLQLLRNPQVARAMGLNGQRLFRNEYSWECQEASLLAFYGKILGRPGLQGDLAEDREWVEAPPA